jgi:hypothetical protein
MDTTLTVSLGAGAITTFVLELIKTGIRKWIVKNEEFDFPPIFYELLIPLLTAFFGLLLYFIGIGEGQYISWKSLLEWFLSVIFSLGTYILVYKPFKEYTRLYRSNTKG